MCLYTRENKKFKMVIELDPNKSLPTCLTLVMHHSLFFEISHAS